MSAAAKRRRQNSGGPEAVATDVAGEHHFDEDGVINGDADDYGEDVDENAPVWMNLPDLRHSVGQCMAVWARLESAAVDADSGQDSLQVLSSMADQWSETWQKVKSTLRRGQRQRKKDRRQEAPDVKLEPEPGPGDNGEDAAAFLNDHLPGDASAIKQELSPSTENAKVSDLLSVLLRLPTGGGGLPPNYDVLQGKRPVDHGLNEQAYVQELCLLLLSSPSRRHQSARFIYSLFSHAPTSRRRNIYASRRQESLSGWTRKLKLYRKYLADGSPANAAAADTTPHDLKVTTSVTETLLRDGFAPFLTSDVAEAADVANALEDDDEDSNVDWGEPMDDDDGGGEADNLDDVDDDNFELDTMPEVANGSAAAPTTRRKRGPKAKASTSAVRKPYRKRATNDSVDYDQVKELIKYILKLPKDQPYPTDFDVLQGKDASHHGLSRSAWVQEVAMLLLSCPLFKHKDDPIFFSKLLKSTPMTWRVRMSQYKHFLEGNRSRTNMARISRCSAIVHELADKGFVNFAIDPSEVGLGDVKQQSADDVDQPLLDSQIKQDNDDEEEDDWPREEPDQKPPLAKSEDKPYVGRGKKVARASLYRHPQKDWLRERLVPGQSLQANTTPGFKAYDFYSYNRSLIPYMEVAHTGVLLALSFDKDVGTPGVEWSCRAKVIARHRDLAGPGDRERDMASLLNLLENSLGMSLKAIYKSREMMPLTGGRRKYKIYSKSVTYREYKTWAELDDESMRRTLAEFEAEWKHYTTAKPPVDLSDVPGMLGSAGRGRLELNIVEDIPAHEVSTVALLSGDGRDNQMLKSLFTAGSFESYMTQAPLAVGAPQSFKHSHMTKVFFELFSYLADFPFTKMCTEFPDFGEMFEKIRRLWNKVYACQCIAEKEQRQCDHCGETFILNKYTYSQQKLTQHLERCKLEHSSCDCGLTFRTPREKRKHFITRHSGVQYLECSECNYLTKSQKALDGHVDYMHGFPGREEVCEFCAKTFRCRYHLSIHQFSHEKHFCQICHIEITGRLPFNNHMKRDHQSGFTCDLCGKVILTKVELEKHKKMHGNSWQKS